MADVYAPIRLIPQLEMRSLVMNDLCGHEVLHYTTGEPGAATEVA